MSKKKRIKWFRTNHFSQTYYYPLLGLLTSAERVTEYYEKLKYEQEVKWLTEP